MERPSENTCRTLASTSLPSPGPNVCVHLLENLLHEIIALFNSFQYFLAFIGTCHSWRSAVSTFPSVYAFSFPPFHFKQMALMFIHVVAISRQSFYLVANGSSVIFARKTYPSTAQCLKIIQIRCTIWAAHMGI